MDTLIIYYQKLTEKHDVKILYNRPLGIPNHFNFIKFLNRLLSRWIRWRFRIGTGNWKTRRITHFRKFAFRALQAWRRIILGNGSKQLDMRRIFSIWPSKVSRRWMKYFRGYDFFRFPFRRDVRFVWCIHKGKMNGFFLFRWWGRWIFCTIRRWGEFIIILGRVELFANFLREIFLRFWMMPFVVFYCPGYGVCWISSLRGYEFWFVCVSVGYVRWGKFIAYCWKEKKKILCDSW